MALTIADLEFSHSLHVLVYSGTPSEAILAGVTHILSPSCQIWMVYPPFSTHTMPWPDRHIFGRRDESDRADIWVLLRNPYRDWEGIRRASERNR